MDWRKFFKSFHYAFQGIILAVKEQNMRLHLTSAFVVIMVGWWTGLSRIEWCIILLVIFLVVAAEIMNTAIERVVDLAHPSFHPLAKQAKDLAAGAVLVIACMSVIVGLFIFWPKWF